MVVIYPFLEYSGLNTLLKYEEDLTILNSQTPQKNCWIDSEGLHIVFENVGTLNKTGIFHDSLFKRSHSNYFLLLMYGILPKNNVNECIQTILIPTESNFYIIPLIKLFKVAKKIPGKIFGWLLQLKYPGLGLCLHEGIPDIDRKLQFLGFLINLTPDEMVEIFEKYQSLIGEDASSEEKFNVSFEIMPKPKTFIVDYSENAYKSIDDFEGKYKDKYEVIFCEIRFFSCVFKKEG